VAAASVWHQLVEASGVDVRGERDRTVLVGGIDDAEQRLGGVGRDRQHPDVVDHEKVGADQPSDRLGDAVVGALAAQHHCQALKCVPGDGLAAIDREVPECLDQVRFPGPARPAGTEILRALDPLECSECLPGGLRDRRGIFVPGVEGLAGRQPRLAAAHPDRRLVAASRLLGQQHRRTSVGSQRWLVGCDRLRRRATDRGHP
jgi:hypothetical protein